RYTSPATAPRYGDDTASNSPLASRFQVRLLTPMRLPRLLRRPVIHGPPLAPLLKLHGLSCTPLLRSRLGATVLRVLPTQLLSVWPLNGRVPSGCGPAG